MPPVLTASSAPFAPFAELAAPRPPPEGHAQAAPNGDGERAGFASGDGLLRLWPLGGLGEVGMNCLALEQRGEVLLVDCGVGFDHRGLGVDVVHPDFASLSPFQGKIAGIFLTHGHEDHIGAVAYFLRQYDVPVWGPPYALGLLRERTHEHEVLRYAKLIETAPRRRYGVGSFEVEPIRVTHSIADATALAIRTDAGVVVHTGDFKFDETPTDGESFDVERFEALGDEGVSLLLSDSTNIDARGETGSEVRVGEALAPMIAAADGLVVVSMFASNVHRLRILGDIARKTRRRIVPLGRSVTTHARVARATGYLDWPPDLLWPAERIRELRRSEILVVATGSQAEPNAALARLGRGEHPAVDLREGDLVVLSSRVIPGNEPEVFAMLGDLIRSGVELRTWMSDREVHVSGHAYRSEQTRMIELVRPRAFVPVHGTLHHLTRHAELARELGVKSVCVLENGDRAAIDRSGVRKDGRVPSGRVHVFAGRAIPGTVLKQRASLAAEGIVFAVATLHATGTFATELAITTRGVLDEEERPELLDDARRAARAAVLDLDVRGRSDDGACAEAIRLAVRRAIARGVGYKPNTVVHVVRLP